MIQRIYIENNVRNHPRVNSILQKYSKARLISIERYTDVFNNRSQNFRLQKANPALILAKKHGRFVLPTPVGFGIGGTKNFYFSHMMNCIYDCRYCFLQGMYSSANYVLFINFEDFDSEIAHLIRDHPNEKLTFFSGYDCDSLALEKLSGFVSHILPIFRNHKTAILELRTKSVQIQPLHSVEPINNCVVAFSMMPNAMSLALDNKTPSIPKRLTAIKKLAGLGWKVGLRFDPLIYGENWKYHYQQLFDQVFTAIPTTSIHSVSYGPLRFPKSMYKKLFKLYPEETLLCVSLSETNGIVAYCSDIELEMANFCKEQFAKFISNHLVFQCTTEAQSMPRTH